MTIPLNVAARSTLARPTQLLHRSIPFPTEAMACPAFAGAMFLISGRAVGGSRENPCYLTAPLEFPGTPCPRLNRARITPGAVPLSSLPIQHLPTLVERLALAAVVTPVALLNSRRPTPPPTPFLPSIEDWPPSVVKELPDTSWCP